jgi:hypothetical protein
LKLLPDFDVNPFFTSKSGKSEKLKIGMTKLIWDVTFFSEGGVGWPNLCHWQPSDMIFTILYLEGWVKRLGGWVRRHHAGEITCIGVAQSRGHQIRAQRPAVALTK